MGDGGSFTGWGFARGKRTEGNDVGAPGGGTSQGRVASCTLMFLLTISGRSSSID